MGIRRIKRKLGSGVELTSYEKYKLCSTIYGQAVIAFQSFRKVVYEVFEPVAIKILNICVAVNETARGL